MNVTTTTLGFQKLAGFFYSGLGATYTTTVTAGTGEIKSFNVLKRPLSGSAAGSIGVGGGSGTVVYTEDADVEFELEVWGQVTRVGTFVITSVPTGGRQGSGLASYEVSATELEGIIDPKTGRFAPFGSIESGVPNVTLTHTIGQNVSTQFAFVTIKGGVMKPDSQIQIMANFTKLLDAGCNLELKAGAASGNYASAVSFGGQGGLTNQRTIGIDPEIWNNGTLNSQLATPVNMNTPTSAAGLTLASLSIDTALDWNIYFGLIYTTIPVVGDSVTLRKFRVDLKN